MGEKGLELRKAREEDLPAIGRLFDEAREALKAAGIDQWQNGYPNEEDARRDVELGFGYVQVLGGKVVAYACLGFGEEPTYRRMEGGRWLGRGEYGFLHRAAVSGGIKGRGAAGRFFEELKAQAVARGLESVRGDTHRDNGAMRRVMAKSGMEYRGVIHVEDGTERLAYECLLEGAEFPKTGGNSC